MRDFRAPETPPMNSNVPVRRTLISVAALLLAPYPAALVHAGPVVWTGFGASAFWSDALNWSPQDAPSDGSDVVFSGAPPRTSSVFDLSRTFSSLSFNADAPLFTTHVSGGGAQLAFSGVGIRSLDSVGAATGRQIFFADAGSTGGTILFTNSSGVNVGSYQFARPVDITAQGGSLAGAIGGHIVFQDRSTTSGTTFDALRAAGASVAGASGGEVIFRDNALLTRQAGVVAGGGSSGGAQGGSATFLGQAQFAGGASALAGQSGGLGGRLDFSGNTVALATSSIYAEGGTSALAGSEAVASFRGDASFMGSAYLGAGGVAGANGGRIDFYNRAVHDTASFDAGVGTLGIYNVGATAIGASGGALVFHDDSAVRGSHLLINNQTAEYIAPGALAGSTSFLDRSRAGQVQIENAGAGGAGAAGGTTYFRNQASAENATITSRGGVASGAGGGSTQFSDSASAGASSLRNAGGSTIGAPGGTLDFRGDSRAGTATIVNAPGEVLGAAGGVTTFSGNAGASSAYISNQTSLNAGGGGRGTTFFTGSSSAQQATIDNQGGIFPINAFTAFSQSATAGNALITNFGGSLSGVSGGFTTFTDQSTAGTATLIVAGGGVNGAFGGRVDFFVGATAGSATLSLLGASVAGAAGGTVNFADGSSAGSALLSVQGSQANAVGGPEGAVVTFDGGTSSAAAATFSIGGNLYDFGRPGRVFFTGGSTAGTASFANLAGYHAGGRLSFEGDALHLTTAGSASITNGSRSAASASSSGGDFGGGTLFLARSTADHATITNEAGITAFGAQTVFRLDSSAAYASIVNAGGGAGATGGITFFQDTADAGRALIDNRAGFLHATGLTRFGDQSSAAQAVITAAGGSATGQSGGWVLFVDRSTAAFANITADGGPTGGGGGRIEFHQQAKGGVARIVLGAGSTPDSGATLDISGVDVWLSVGSIEGGGSVNLGNRSLILINNLAATTFSGVIGGAAPPVFPSLAVQAGSLTLSGANLYSGRTSIGDGVNANSGKLVAANSSGSATGSGAVLIERGGTLAGSGFIAGPVTLLDGGTIAPGDPVTLTLRDSLTWNGGGVIRLVLGADDASSDHLVVHRLVRGAPGSFVFQFINDGITPAASYSLLQFDQIEGFAVQDFSFVGLAGSLSLVNGTLGFAAAVPEPAEALLFVAGLLCIWRVRLAADRRHNAENLAGLLAQDGHERLMAHDG
jgi:fibronectin-binding autotransporter adhesin